MNSSFALNEIWMQVKKENQHLEIQHMDYIDIKAPCKFLIQSYSEKDHTPLLHFFDTLEPYIEVLSPTAYLFVTTGLFKELKRYATQFGFNPNKDFDELMHYQTTELWYNTIN